MRGKGARSRRKGARCKWKLLIQGISLGEDIEAESQKAACLLVETALQKAIIHLNCVKRNHEMNHHNLILRLAQDDVDILNSTLATLT
ncbi:hypothetical protein ElyMa_003553800 [Elysia marginata]|uniref:Uncharacterized protein n=1 Tax=Elysia marginata TaxID=1093978 RepID=A0AAV4EM27_9GAST|nr:hypothetical protein ElyMa_003553800 [Elysia marginata]